MTESAFFASASQKDCFSALGVKEYEIVATLDSHTSYICISLDHKVFKMSDYKPGITAPPFHCWCRSCTAPHFADNDDGMRAARGNNGKTYYVPANMKYPEWKAKYVDNTVELPKVNEALSKIIKKQEVPPKMQNLFGKYLNDDYVDIDETNHKLMYYDSGIGKIVVNPNHLAIDNYDLPKSLTHEVIHLIDDNEGLAVANAALLAKNMDEAQKYILNHADYYKKIVEFGQYEYNISISDLFSNLTENKIVGRFGHEDSYWSRIGMREKELIAGLLTEYIANDAESLKLIGSIPALKSIFDKLVEEYDKITG